MRIKIPRVNSAPLHLGRNNVFGRSALRGVNSGGAGPPPFSGLLDSVSANVVAAFSPRRLLTSFTSAPMRMRVQPGTTEADIAFNAMWDNIDTTARDAFLGLLQGRLVTYYNQAGSNNATQATAGVQLTTKDAGGVLAVNGKQAVKGSGVAGQNTRAVTPSFAHGIGTGDFLVSFAIVYTTPTNAENGLASFGSYNPAFYTKTNSGGVKPTIYLGAYRVFNTTLVNGTRYVLTFARESGTLKCWVNGTLEATTFAGVTTNVVTSTINLMAEEATGGSPGADCVVESLFFKSALTSERAAIIASQMAFIGL